MPRRRLGGAIGGLDVPGLCVASGLTAGHPAGAGSADSAARRGLPRAHGETSTATHTVGVAAATRCAGASGWARRGYSASNAAMWVPVSATDCGADQKVLRVRVASVGVGEVRRRGRGAGRGRGNYPAPRPPRMLCLTQKYLVTGTKGCRVLRVSQSLEFGITLLNNVISQIHPIRK